MPAMPIIPFEVQDQIVAHASQRGAEVSSQDITDTLRVCSLVCTDWYTLTRRWIFRRIELKINFSNSRQTSGDVNESVRAFLEYVKANPAILDHIESVHVRLARKTTSRRGLETPAAKEALGLAREICTALSPTIQEVSLSCDTASLIQDSPFLRDALAALYCGARVHTVYMHNSMVPPSLILRSSSLKNIVLDECHGVTLPMSVIEAVLLNRLNVNVGAVNMGLSSLVIDNTKPAKIWSHIWRFLEKIGNVDAFFSGIEKLSLSLSHSVYKSGPWDAKLYGSHLTSLRLSYISVEDNVHLPSTLVERFTCIPWSTLVNLTSLSVNIQLALFSGVISDDNGGSLNLLRRVARLPALAELSIHYSFTNRFESITSVQNTLARTCQQTIDVHFSKASRFRALRAFKLGVRLMIGQSVVISGEDEFEEMIKECLPSIYGANGRVDNGLTAILYPSLQ